MQAPVSKLQCSECGETFRSSTAMQQHIDQTRHMISLSSGVPEEYRVEGNDKIFYCKRCHKPFTAVAAVLQHHAAKHSAPQRTFYRRCGDCNMEQTTAFGWLNHRGDCKKVNPVTRDKIKLVGLKCLASPATCTSRCAGIGMILHLKDEHGIDPGYFEDDFAEKFQAQGLVEILAVEETKSLPQYKGLQQQKDLSDQWNDERLKRLSEARLRVLHSEGEDLASRRAREFHEYMEWLKVEQSQKERERRMKILREKEDACAAALEAEKQITAERRRNAAAVFAEVRSAFEKTSALVKSQQTTAAKEELRQIVLKLRRQTENADQVTRKESFEFKEHLKADVVQLQGQLQRLQWLKSTVKRIVDRIAAARAVPEITTTSAKDRHNVASGLLESLGKYSDHIRYDGSAVYDRSMSSKDIMKQEQIYYGSKRKPQELWVPSYNWVNSCIAFEPENVVYRQLFESYDKCLKSNTSKCGQALQCPKIKQEKGEEEEDFLDLFETSYVFEEIFFCCYFFVKHILGLDASKSPFAMRFLTDPVFFFQASCLTASNSSRFPDDFTTEFVDLMHLEHPDFDGIIPVVVDEMKGCPDLKSGSKKNNWSDNNMYKFVCCIPLCLRHTLHDALPVFSRKLFAKKPKVETSPGQEFEYTTHFGETYSIFFGSMFYLDIMRARAHLKCSPPNVAAYVRACLSIRFDIDAMCLEVPWQDIILSVRASHFLRSDAQPSHHDWEVMLDISFKDIDSDHSSYLLSSDVSAYAEMWALLDRAYDTPAKGFFDFEHNAKLVYQSIQEASRFLADHQFEAWWSKILTLRHSKSAFEQNRREMEVLAPAHAPAVSAFWDRSERALWFLNFILHSRNILTNEYDKPQLLKAVGSKRPSDFAPLPDTFRQLFEFVSKKIFYYDEANYKQMLVIFPGTVDWKVFKNFSEWLEFHNSSTKSRN